MVYLTSILEYVYGETSTTANTNSSSKISDFNGDKKMKGESSTTITTSRDPKIMQTKNYFIDDVNTNICERYGKKAMNDVKNQLKKDFKRVNQHLRKGQIIL